MNYDVQFHNQAIEQLLGFDDIQKNLHTPSLLFTKQLKSLHALTQQDNKQLETLDAQVVGREDHVHN